MRSCSTRRLLVPLFVGALTAFAGGDPAAAQTAVRGDLPAISTLQWRNIGPFRGGRSTAVAGSPADVHTYYMGTAGGGVWKTTNTGMSWENISDGFFKTSSVGHLAVAPSNPNIIYVGMGENTARANTVSHGDGVYKSTDGGKTWQNVGLSETQVISRVRIDPRNPDVVYVGAQGALYAPSQDRGVYRSTDGGATWKRVFFPGETGGVADLAMDLTNSRVLYAAVWDHQRSPWNIRDRGPLGGIHKSTDGGETWQKLAGGLPTGQLGKPAVATTSNPNRVYALVTGPVATQSGVYRSDDAGTTWTLTNSTSGLTGRQWYYNKIYADPSNPDVVWVLSSTMYRSTDGGRTFTVANSPHPDRHDLWINPTNSRYAAIVDDGGTAVSVDGGATWSSQSNQPTGQFYRVSVDNGHPYRLYAGQQDNTSISIASGALSGAGIGRGQWHPVAGYENSFVDVDADAPDITYGNTNQDGINVVSQSTGITRPSSPYPLFFWGNSASRFVKYRYSLHAPVVVSRHPTKTLYLGAQRLLASNDQGRTWREISPDVTRWGTEAGRDKRLVPGSGIGGEGSYGVIIYFAESPIRPGILWTGSDDGLVASTRDGGRNWRLGGIPGMGDARINAIDASPHDSATAYIAVSRFQFDDKTPYFFKTSDFGRSWTRIGSDLPGGGWARVIREDPVRKGLLYAGTELGIYFSLDDGRTWHPLNNNLPVTPIYDLKIHNNDLVVATGGRAFWILDNVSPLREIDRARTADAYLFRPRAATLSNLGSGGSGWEGNVGWGENPPSGAMLDFYLANSGPVKIEIRNSAGTVVRRLAAGTNDDPSAQVIRVAPGMNRILWNMRGTPIAAPTGGRGGGGGGGGNGLWARPGNYTVSLTAGGRTMTAPLQIRPMPGSKATPAAYAERDRFLETVGNDLAEFRVRSAQISGVRAQADSALQKLTDSTAAAAARAYVDKLRLESELNTHLTFLYNRANIMEPHVDAGMRQVYAQLHGEWLKARGIADRVLGSDLAAFNRLLAQAGIPEIQPVVPPIRRATTGGRGGGAAEEPPE